MSCTRYWSRDLASADGAALSVAVDWVAGAVGCGAAAATGGAGTGCAGCADSTGGTGCSAMGVGATGAGCVALGTGLASRGAGFGGSTFCTGVGGGAGAAGSGSIRRAMSGAGKLTARSARSIRSGKPSRSSACSASDARIAYWKTRLCPLGEITAAHAQRTPHLFRGQRHLEMRQLERIEHRVHHRRHRADGAELAAALHAEQVGLAGHAFVETRAQRRQLVGARRAVVHQRAGHELAAALFIAHLFPERLAGALRHAAMDLPLDDGVVDDAADVVAAGERGKCYLAGLVVDFHLRDLRAVRPRGRRWRLRGGNADHARRLACRQLAQLERAIGARDAQPTVAQLDIGDCGLQRLGCRFLALLDHLVAGCNDRGATDEGRARADAADAVRPIRVALNDLYLGDRDP